VFYTDSRNPRSTSPYMLEIIIEILPPPPPSFPYPRQRNPTPYAPADLATSRRRSSYQAAAKAPVRPTAQAPTKPPPKFLLGRRQSSCRLAAKAPMGRRAGEHLPNCVSPPPSASAGRYPEKAAAHPLTQSSSCRRNFWSRT
jgi:hypothetical protein